MAKYSYELKMKIVQDYLNQRGGYLFLANKYGISGKTTIQKWVASYKAMGKESLKRSRQIKSYSVQFKRDAVELYLTTEVSYQDLAIALDVNNPALLANWVRKYRSDGIEGLSKRKGRPPKMSPGKKSKNTEPHKTEGSQELHIEELEKRVHRLEIENAFLKELRRLRSEESQKPMKKSQESSTPSEDGSN